MTVAPYAAWMMPRVQYICRRTGPDAAMTDENIARYILDCYCNYYLEHEAAHCFVLLDEQNEVAGYTLSATDHRAYKKGFAPYLKRILRTPGAERGEVLAEQLALQLFAPRYPAHLHIDLLDEVTGQGGGTRLIQTLLSHLKALQVPGVMLIVGSGNVDAIRFYRRQGFHTLLALGGGTVMGLRLK